MMIGGDLFHQVAYVWGIAIDIFFSRINIYTCHACGKTPTWSCECIYEHPLSGHLFILVKVLMNEMYVTRRLFVCSK